MAKKKAAGGRPKLPPLDWEEIDKLLKMQCTGEEIAGFLDISYNTLERRCKSDKKSSFEEYSAKKKKGGRASLRRRQWLKAIEDANPTMLIWLGKQYLGQSEKVESEVHSHEYQLAYKDKSKIKDE